MKYPRQTILVVLKVIFTQLIEQSSKGNDIEQVGKIHFILIFFKELFSLKQKLISLSKELVEEIGNIRERSTEEYLLINKEESIGKIEEVLLLFSSYLTRFPINVKSFEWNLTLKYYFNKQISIKVFSFELNFE